MGFLSDLLPHAEAELDLEARKRSYRTDVGLWAGDILGLQLWSKQRAIAQSVADCKYTAVAAGHGVGKDLPLSTPLPTPTGWTTMGEVQPGDYLLDEAGLPTRVLTKSEVFNHDLFEVGFSDGTSQVASGTHLWQTIDFAAAKAVRRSEGWTGDWRNHWHVSQTRTTLEIAESLTRPNGAGVVANHTVPINAALELPTAELPVHPYILGAWLGDGTSSAAAMTVGDEGLWIVEEFARCGVRLTPTKGKYAFTFANQGYRELLRGLGVFKNKHVPQTYLRASIAQRRELLRGVMDTDGFHIHGAGVGVDFANEVLAHGVAELVRSLGSKVNVRAGAMYLGSTIVGTRYRLSWTPESSPFTSGTAKDLRWSPPKDPRRTARTVTYVRPVESEPSQCVSVDSPRSLYLAGENMLVTHNTFLAGVIALWWIDTHPLGESTTFVASTAPSKDQVDLLWGNIREMHALMARRFKEGLIDHGPPGYITGENKWKLPDGQLIGQGRKPPDSKTDVAFQGRHATYLLAIGDEAVGLTADLIDALNNITTGPHNRQLLLMNPTDPGCAAAKIWPDEDGRGGNPEWNRIHISMLDSPMITKEPGFDLSRAQGLSDAATMENARIRYGGEEDPRYVARVLGQWAWDNGAGLFPEAIISRAVRTVVVPDETDDRLRFGVDVSRAGVDSTEVYECREGFVWETGENGELLGATEERGFRFRRVDGWSGAKVTSSDPENLGTAQRLNTLAKEYRTNVVNIDASGGLGVGVFDAIHELEDQGEYFMYEVFGNDMKGVDRRAFINLRAFMFSELKKEMALGHVDLEYDDEELLDQLRGIRAKITDGEALQIEGKRDMAKRGAKSPDRADAVWYAMVWPLDDSEYQVGDVLTVDPRAQFGMESSWFAEQGGLGSFGW